MIATTFTGRDLTLPDLKQACATTHLRLCCHLDLAPHYLQPGMGPRAEIFLPLRRQTTEARRRFADSVARALVKVQPDNEIALAGALASDGATVGVRKLPRTGGAPVWLFASDGIKVPGTDLSEELGDRRIRARFAAARLLRALRRTIDRKNLLSALAATGPTG